MQTISMTVNQACEATGVGRTTIYKLLKNGSLTKHKLGGKTLILTEELKAYIGTLPEVGTGLV